MRFWISFLSLCILISQPLRAEETIVYCGFNTLPPMTMILRGGMGADDNTLQVGNNKLVPLSIGSSLSLAKIDGNEYIISWQYPASVTVAKLDGSNAKFTRSGECSSSEEVFSLAQVVDTETAVSQGFFWDDVTICKAALETYFFLSEAPMFQKSAYPLHIFESKAGNSYACTINKSVAEFIWFNQQGEKMSSRSTTFSISGANLKIVSDMQTKTFRIPN